MSALGRRLLALDAALNECGFPHAFGGAIALAYCTREPRSTRDLDVNVFVGTERADEVLDAMPSGVTVGRADRIAARREGQVRVMWDETPIDLFFNANDFHREVAEAVREVPFEGTTVQVLDGESLIVLKARFNQTRHWADIEAILETGMVDGRRALERLRTLLEESDPAIPRLTELLAHPSHPARE